MGGRTDGEMKGTSRGGRGPLAWTPHKHRAWRVPHPCAPQEGICHRTLLGPAFSECNTLVDPAVYVAACTQDLCRCPDCPCATFAEYSRQCAHAGGQPQNWRGPDLCRECPLAGASTRPHAHTGSRWGGGEGQDIWHLVGDPGQVESFGGSYSERVGRGTEGSVGGPEGGPGLGTAQVGTGGPPHPEDSGS